MSTGRVAPNVGWKAKALVALFAIVIAVGLCEVAARVAFPAPPDRLREPRLLYQADPELGFFHVPDQQGWLDDGFATINGLGLRGAMPVMPKPAGTFRILAVGDSTTFGWGVNDDETWCAALERQFKEAHPDRRVEVVNAGVVSYDLKQSARLLGRLAPRLQPDVVIVGLFWNDLPYKRVEPDGDPGRLQTSTAALDDLDSELPPGARSGRTFRMGNRPSELNLWLRSSRLLYALRHGWLSGFIESGVAENQVLWEDALLTGRETPAIDAAWRDVEATLGGISSFAGESGFPVGVLVVPIRAQVEQSHPHAAYQTRVAAIARTLGMFVIDPLPRLTEHAQPADLFIPYDRMHFSGRGNHLLAGAVLDVLRDRPIWAAHVN